MQDARSTVISLVTMLVSCSHPTPHTPYSRLLQKCRSRAMFPPRVKSPAWQRFSAVFEFQGDKSLAICEKITVVPEPATMSLLAIAAIGILVHTWRRRPVV